MPFLDLYLTFETDSRSALERMALVLHQRSIPFTHSKGELLRGKIRPTRAAASYI
jgi:hypothetical protein